MAQSRPAEIKALSGARAFPPLLIVLYHFCEGHGYRGIFWFDALVAKGYIWVEFFFALSGFILMHVYGARAAAFFRDRAYGDFLKTRLARLYPIHLFMLFALLALMVAVRAAAHWGGYVSYYDGPGHPDMRWQGFVLSLLLIHGWNTLHTLTWNGASWFVSVEFLLVLLFPLYALAARGGGWLRGLSVTAAGFAVLAWMATTSHHGIDITYHNGIFRGMAGFAVGVGFAMLHRALAPRAARAPEAVHSAVQAALLAFLWWAIWKSGWAHKPTDIWTVLALDLFVLALAFDRGFAARLLALSPVLALGEWSYAIYMGQTFWLQLLHPVEQRLYPAPDAMVLGLRWQALAWWLEPALLLLVCVAWGALLTRFIETPANAWLRQRLVPRRG